MFYKGLYGILPTDKTKKNLTKFQNNIEFTNVLNNLLNLSLDIYKWKNLPDTCDERLMESALLFRGYMALYKDSNGTVWSYSAGPGGELTRYGYPSKGYLYALNGEVEQCNLYWPFMDNADANGVLCLDNKMGYPMINEIIQGAYRISDAKRSLDTIAKHIKRPFIFAGSQEQVDAMKSIYNDIDNNEPFLIVDDEQMMSLKATTLSTNIESGAIKEAWDYYINTRNDVLNRLGINTKSNNDKKERMTTTETLGDLEFTQKQQDYRLEERQKFCDRVNEAFGLNISVDYKQSAAEIMMQQNQLSQGGNNEQDTSTSNN